MAEAESAADCFASYGVALAALRMRAVVNGDVFPREDEPIDLMTLAAIGEARGV